MILHGCIEAAVIAVTPAIAFFNVKYFCLCIQKTFFFTKWSKDFDNDENVEFIHSEIIILETAVFKSKLWIVLAHT